MANKLGSSHVTDAYSKRSSDHDYLDWVCRFFDVNDLVLHSAMSGRLNLATEVYPAKEIAQMLPVPTGTCPSPNKLR